MIGHLQDLMSSILDIMGLKAGEVNDSDTLMSMGIDSMQLVEVSCVPKSSDHVQTCSASNQFLDLHRSQICQDRHVPNCNRQPRQCASGSMCYPVGLWLLLTVSVNQI